MNFYPIVRNGLANKSRSNGSVAIFTCGTFLCCYKGVEGNWKHIWRNVMTADERRTLMFEADITEQFLFDNDGQQVKEFLWRRGWGGE